MTQPVFPALASTTPVAGVVFGDADDDQIWGTWQNDELYGDGEMDTIYGGGGDDRIIGGASHDKLYGQSGNDTIEGQGGTDTIHGGPDNDLITGDEEFDFLFGNDGSDDVHGGGGDDIISGGPGDDFLYGDYGYGDDGRDLIQGDEGDDFIDGGDLIDVLWSKFPGGPVDQPWRGNGQGNPAWFDMDASGPDTDGDCDLEDGHIDLDGNATCATVGVVAINDTYGVSHGSTLTRGLYNILSNDSFDRMTPPGPTIQVTHTTVHGILNVYGDGTFDYDPRDTFVGADSFVYYLTQNGVTSTYPAVVVINVTNATPTAFNDADSTPKGMAVTIPVTGNDLDADPGDHGTLVIDAASLTDPPNGSVSISADGRSVVYTPDPGWPPMGNQQDIFYYKSKDIIGAISNPAEVRVTVLGMNLTFDGSPVEPSADTPSITDADLAMLAAEAAQRWVLAGVDPITAQRALEGTQFVVADLPGSVLGGETPGTIFIDVNAAGYGWFVDASASLDEEFSVIVSASERQAGTGSAAYGRVDLLTVMMHEFGHALGMIHLDGEEFEHSVMHDTLGLSTRRVPTAADILAADEYFASLWEAGSTLRRRRW